MTEDRAGDDHTEPVAAGQPVSEKRSIEILHRIDIRPLVLAVVILGLGWFAVQSAERQFSGQPFFLGSNKLTDTHVWADGNVEIDWGWRRTGLSTENDAGVDTTLCIARGYLRNRDDSEFLAVSSVSLLLVDTSGFELHEHSETLAWTTADYDFLDAPIDNRLEPGEEREFTFRYSVPTALLQDVSALSARLGFEFDAPDQGLDHLTN